MKREYDVIFFCDVCKYPKLVVNWDRYAELILNNESGCLVSLHPDRANNIYNECEMIFRYGKDTRENMLQMRQYLLKNNMPPNSIMPENTTFAYNPKNEKITKAFTDFWDVYSNECPTHRDQPLWGYMCWKHQIKPIIFNKGRPRHRMHLILYDKIANTQQGFNGHTYT